MGTTPQNKMDKNENEPMTDETIDNLIQWYQERLDPIIDHERSVFSFFPALTDEYELYQFSHKIASLASWAEGWNGYDACAPHPKAIKNAIRWIQDAYAARPDMDLYHKWLLRNVTADAEGEVVLECRWGNKEFTLSFGDQAVSYFVSEISPLEGWGAHMEIELKNGSVSSAEALEVFIEWLDAA